ncbi:ABC transporter substrate-binding protein [Clostridium sp. CX1]|uniref:ABC transporter substrate-binding protein n=1 Tax=Clostridium sp. CX1 TaxID=2978346 RepID=UPI0021BF0DF6|nr:ABC transporter substrate-binding protein [Clostridium sp. CX1]MCT8978160.1 ABC transporter substrate-binding protein [Clostridium sp. CX1]
MINFKKIVTFLICSIFVISLSACSNKSSSSENSNGSSNNNSKITSYPLTFKDFYGRDVKIDKEPQRIVSGAPNITEILFALGEKDKLVGRTDFCNFPQETKSIQSIGGIQNPNIEKIVELKPDILIASSIFPKEAVEKLEALNVKVVIIQGDESFEGTYTTIKKVGQIANANEKAAEIVTNMEKKIAEVKEKVTGKNTPSVYYVISYGKDGDFTAGKNTFISKMISMAGGKNAADDAEGWAYSLEKLIEKNPDILVCSTYIAGSPDDIKTGIKNTNGYKDLTAVKNNKLFDINPDILERQGPRLAEGFEQLAKIIHPEAFK